MQLIASLNKIFNPPIPPLVKGPACRPSGRGEGGLFTKWGLGGITGLTLVEVMIALVIVLLVFLALMQTALVSIDSNMRNILRDEATNIAEQRMNEARDLQFTQLVDNLGSDTVSLSADGCVSADCPTGFSTTGECVPRDVRSISGFKFCTNRTAVLNSTNTDIKQVTITVGWKWKGEDYTHSISTIVRKR